MGNLVRKYGKPPYDVALLHGGPGAAGEMKPVAEVLSKDFGVLELLQSKDSITGQIEEVHTQLISYAEIPAVLVGFSWGAWLGLLFAARYPELVRRLILISSGALECQGNRDLMPTRLGRLNESNRKEAEEVIARLHSGSSDGRTLKRFGELMAIADSFDYLPGDDESIGLNVSIYESIWGEASKLRETNELVRCADDMDCPVIAFHGDFDPHPIEGVEAPLSKRLKSFKMIRLERCGHTPWKERQAKDTFYRLLREELRGEF